MSKQVLKRRIKATEQVAKVTKAMSNVAGRKLQKTHPMLKSATEYLVSISILLKECPKENVVHPFLSHVQGTGAVAMIIATDKGLVGGLNRELVSFVKRQAGFSKTVIIGQKGIPASPVGSEIVYVLRGVGDLPTPDQISPIVSLITKMFEKGEVNGLSIFFHEYISASSHRPTRLDIFPLLPTFFNNGLVSTLSHDTAPQILFEKLSHQYLFASVYRALTSAKAAEHATRVSAMQAASQNATSMRQDLLGRSFKQNQRAITSEIADTVNARRAISL